MDISNAQLLAALRIDATQAQTIEKPFDNQNKTDFSNMLAQAVQNVNQIQKESGRLVKEFELGNENVTILDVKIAGQKSSIATEATYAVRDKAVDAFKEIMNLQF